MIPAVPNDPIATGSEREILEDTLEFHRSRIKRKVFGVTDADARRRLVPSKTTLGGLLRHLAAVERNWFQWTLGRRSPAQIGANWRANDESWAVGPSDTIELLIKEYDEAIDQSRLIAAAFDLDDTVAHAKLGRVSLRWIYVHMIEETAQHVGHADILREQIDAHTGPRPFAADWDRA